MSPVAQFHLDINLVLAVMYFTSIYVREKHHIVSILAVFVFPCFLASILVIFMSKFGSAQS